MIENVEWLKALIGGIIIGVAAALFLYLNGRILGVSGIVGGLARPKPDASPWRLAFIGGVIVTGVIFLLIHPAAFPPSLAVSPLTLALAGLLVGVGTAIGGGCTSGHGVCGIGRLSKRSIVATLVFMAAAMLTVPLVHEAVR